jgi:uncharacterized damage-inducible protein DinB
MKDHIAMLARYKRWADESLLSMLDEIPAEERVKRRAAKYGSMLHTLNHVHVIDKVFQAHLQQRAHGFTARNTPTHPPMPELRTAVAEVDNWYVAYVDSLSPGELDVPVGFDFIGGGSAVMTRAQMVIHVVNHGTYHRGFIADMMYEVGFAPRATDLTVFLRDVESVPPRS